MAPPLLRYLASAGNLGERQARKVALPSKKQRPQQFREATTGNIVRRGQMEQLQGNPVAPIVIGYGIVLPIADEVLHVCNNEHTGKKKERSTSKF